MATYRVILDDKGQIYGHVKESIERLALSFNFSNSEIDKLTKDIETISMGDGCNLSTLTLEISEKEYVLTMVLKNGITRSTTYLK